MKTSLDDNGQKYTVKVGGIYVVRRETRVAKVSEGSSFIFHEESLEHRKHCVCSFLRGGGIIVIVNL